LGEQLEAAGRPHFGALLRQFRREAGLTQQDLAERARLSVEAVSSLERGVRTRPHRDTVALLSRALGLSPERVALLTSTVGIADPVRQRGRSQVLEAALSRIVGRDGDATPKCNLPQQLTSLVGRRPELDEIVALLREHQLVTVVGAGGVGKTRIVVQLGSEALDRYADGVWFVDLAPLADQDHVSSAIASVLKLPSGLGSAAEAVVAFIKPRRLLLILDNCEHVAARAREIAASIAQTCPDAGVLSTSRQALDAPGERVYRLPSLSTPPQVLDKAREAVAYGAIQLFVDRALAVDARFALNDENAADVAEICRRLDGIPLAIELAAARVKTLAPRQIALRLDQRFRLLTGGDPSALPRQQTMTALIDWSYNLLTPREQAFFESISVFAGGCTLEAATSVCALEGEDDIDVIDLITSLVTKSLLVAELAHTEQRYHLLDSSRYYARDKLRTHAEHERIARRHALFFAVLAERIERGEELSEAEWVRTIQTESENWRAALVWALGQRHDIATGQRLMAVRRVAAYGLTIAEGRHWIGAALDAIDQSTPLGLIARLEYTAADGAMLNGELEVALAAAGRTLAAYRELGNELGCAQAQSLAAAVLVKMQRPADAEPMLHEALRAARQCGDRRLMTVVLERLGWVRSGFRDFGGARAYLSEALELASISGGWRAASVRWSLAQNELFAGDPEAAYRLMVDVVPLVRSLNLRPTLIAALCDAGEHLVALGRFDEAKAHFKDALEVARGSRLPMSIIETLHHLAAATALEPQPKDRSEPAQQAVAGMLLGYVETRLKAANVSVRYRGPNDYEGALAALRAALGNDLPRLMAAGALMTEDEALEQARTLE
jgi:predicted ATPase/transcriptional regulator with XRE-family HTH domain